MDDQTPSLRQVSANPHPWPVRQSIDDTKIGLCLIDLQHDFLSPGGMADRCGYDIAALQPARKRAAEVLEHARARGWTVAHIRVGFPAALPDGHILDQVIPPPSDGAKKLGPPLVRGEAGHEIVEEFAAIEGEFVIDKIGKGSFHGTELDSLLRSRGVTHLVLAGVTSDVCVMSTFRAAHDHGYDTLVLNDATASFWPERHEMAMELVMTQDGLMGCTASSEELFAAAS